MSPPIRELLNAAIDSQAARGVASLTKTGLEYLKDYLSGGQKALPSAMPQSMKTSLMSAAHTAEEPNHPQTAFFLSQVDQDLGRLRQGFPEGYSSKRVDGSHYVVDPSGQTHPYPYADRSEAILGAHDKVSPGIGTMDWMEKQ